MIRREPGVAAKTDPVLRFAWGSATGPQSPVWRVWANRHRGDVYLAARTAAGIRKVSFHESGDWRDAFVASAKAEALIEVVGSRTGHRWQRPVNAPNGWTIGYHVVVPGPDVVEPLADEARETKCDVWIRPPMAGRVGYVTLVWVPLSSVPHVVPEFGDRSEPIGHFALETGEGIWVIAHEEPWPEARTQDLVRFKSNARRLWRDAHPGEPFGDVRAGLLGWHDDGARFVIDAALRVPPEAYADLRGG